MAKQSIKLPSDQDISGRDIGTEEIEAVTRVLKSGVLTSTKGTEVREFEKEFAEVHGCESCVALSSGTAAIHTALAGLELDTGGEIITSSITDMGAVTPIIYEGHIPVFADIDPLSYNITAAAIEKRLTSRTKAIIVTHLFGNPCEMDDIMSLAREHRIPVIEDSAQAYLAEYHGKKVGTIGDIGCFSMQQGKHMTTGEGGMVITNNTDYAEMMRLFVNKAWGYGHSKPDHYFLALNYRLTELQGAVARAQLRKLKDNVDRRCRSAALMNKAISKYPEIHTPRPPDDSRHTYWRYSIDLGGSMNVVQMAEMLGDYGIASTPRYIQKPAFRCAVFQKAQFRQKTSQLVELSVELWNDEQRCREEYPGTYKALSRMLVFPWNEFYGEEHVKFISEKIQDSFEKFSEK